METRDEGPGDDSWTSVSPCCIALFAGIWFGLLWVMILVLAAHAYRVGEATPFRYVGF